MLPPLSLEQTITCIVREEWGRILSSLVKTLGDFQLAEDSLQDAVEAALKHWQKNGLPRSPTGWLITAARRKAIDRIRRDKAFASKQPDLAYLIELANAGDPAEPPGVLPDKRLEMIFTCCHPALPEKTRIALTLRTIGGLTTDEIARAFLDTRDAMARRLVRARQKIKLASIPYTVPGSAHLAERLDGVLSVIYLIFNEGYAASSGAELNRVDLINEAIRLARIMVHLMPGETEISGLLALMLLHDARRLARLDGEGRMVSLEDQNRGLWDKAKAREGVSCLKQALEQGRVGPYQLQAAISALHLEAASWQATDWPQIAALYNLLYALQPSPVVRINQAMAVSHAVSVKAAITLLDEVASGGDMSGYKAYQVARADLMARAGQPEAARGFLAQALALSDNQVERAFLNEKLKALEPDTS